MAAALCVSHIIDLQKCKRRVMLPAMILIRWLALHVNLYLQNAEGYALTDTLAHKSADRVSLPLAHGSLWLLPCTSIYP